MNKAEKHAKQHGIFAMTGTQKPGHQSLQDTLETASISRDIPCSSDRAQCLSPSAYVNKEDPTYWNSYQLCNNQTVLAVCTCTPSETRKIFPVFFAHLHNTHERRCVRQADPWI
jgi:hypothetical protein